MYPGGLEIGEDEKAQVLEVLEHKYLFRYYGPSDCPSKAQQLEETFAQRWGTKHALAMNSCTSTLISALVACGVGPGDEVIVNGYTFFASAAAIVAAKAIPVICDIDDSFTVDPEDLERRITRRTRAIILVHMRGAPCDMDRILPICKKHNLAVIEDVAQACGGSYKGRMLGTLGDIGCFSFQYHKIITAGEGGMAITNDSRLNDRLMAYHDTAACWRPERFAEERYKGELFCGQNFRMSELTGAVMLAQLDKLDDLLDGMRRNKQRIKEQIEDLPGITMRRLNDPDGDTGICLMFMLDDKQQVGRFVDALNAEGIDASGVFNRSIPDWHVYYHWKHLMNQATPTSEGCPWTCPYHEGEPVQYREDMCPNTSRLLSRAVHLDIPPQMTVEDCDMIAAGIQKVTRVLLNGNGE